MKLVRKDNHAIAITGTLEKLLGTCDIADAEMVDGELELTYGGYTEVDWDSQETFMHDGQRIFIDEGGSQVLESEVELIDDEDHEA
ncbi:MAG: hypothetical protein JSS14_22165 [Proteobacteria bacterium]|nr:hypothetical protein [Pseudomonadota bacterium]